MIKGLDVNQRVEFVSAYDTEEPKTIFVLKPLNGEDRANFSNDGTVKLSGTRMYDFLCAGVVDIKNYHIEGDIRTKLVAIQDDNIITELVLEIGKLSRMSRQDEKN